MGSVSRDRNPCQCELLFVTLPKKRFGKTEWIEIGQQLLKSDGPSALTIEQLCKQSGKTRGSFYHHFEDHDAYIAALGEQWREEQTLKVIEDASQSAIAAKQLDDLNDLTSALDLELELAMRQLATRSPLVTGILQRVDRERLEFLELLYSRVEPGFPISARSIAEIEYSAFLGSILLWPMIDKEDRKKLYTDFGTLLRASRDSE